MAIVAATLRKQDVAKIFQEFAGSIQELTT